MHLEKKTTVAGAFARKEDYEYQGQQYEADIKDGDVVTIESAGEKVEGQFGEQYVFAIATRNGNKNINLNQTSINCLVETFGSDTEQWVGQKASVFVVKTMVSGKLRNVAYVVPEGHTMDSEGNFGPGTVVGSSSDETPF